MCLTATIEMSHIVSCLGLLLLSLCIFYKHAGKDFTGLVIFKMLAPIFSAAWSYQLYIMFCDIDNIMLTP